MSPAEPSGGAARPSAVVNAEIRALAKLTDVWTPGQLARYVGLLAELRVAQARERLAQAA